MMGRLIAGCPCGYMIHDDIPVGAPPDFIDKMMRRLEAEVKQNHRCNLVKP